MVEQKFIQPINLSFLHNNQHVIVYFKNHREYKTIEARIKEDHLGKVFIWIVLTRKDESQIDFVNDEDLAKILYTDNPKREVFYREIKFFQNIKSQKPHIEIWFSTHKNEVIALDIYCVSIPSEKFAGMIEIPDDFLPNINLPIMLRKISTFISSKSSITISGRKYWIPVKRYIPFFFKGLNGYYTEDYNLLLFSSIEQHLEVIAVPTCLEIGQSWIYQGENRTYKYTIIEMTETGFLAKIDNQIITVLVQNNTYSIQKIYAESFENYNMNITFSPAIPLSAEEETNVQSEFNIEIDGRKKLVTGKTYVSTYEHATSIAMIADVPAWLHSYSITAIISEKNGKLFSSTLLS